MSAHTGREVAIVVPFYKHLLDADEQVSLAHLEHYLGGYDRYLAAPTSFDRGLDGFELKRFPDRYFANPITYSALMVAPAFYKSFADYRFILLYQLDCLVFADNLLDWCSVGYDYIGAPWFDADFGVQFGVDLFQRPADRAPRRASEELLGGWIPQHDAEVLADAHHGVGQPRQERLVVQPAHRREPRRLGRIIHARGRSGWAFIVSGARSPASSRSFPAAAIIAALSVQSFRDGT